MRDAALLRSVKSVTGAMQVHMDHSQGCQALQGQGIYIQRRRCEGMWPRYGTQVRLRGRARRRRRCCANSRRCHASSSRSREALTRGGHAHPGGGRTADVPPHAARNAVLILSQPAGNARPSLSQEEEGDSGLRTAAQAVGEEDGRKQRALEGESGLLQLTRS